MKHGTLWRKTLWEVLCFILDFILAYLSTYLISSSVVLSFFNPDLPNWTRFTIPRLLFSFLLVLAYKAIYALSTRVEKRICPYIDGIFFSLIAIIGALSYLTLMRASFFYLNYPKIWDLFALLLGIGLAWILPARLRFRRLPIFLSAALFNSLFFVSLVKIYVNEQDFLPIDSSAVKVVCEIADPDRSDEPEKMRPIWNGIIWFLREFSGLLIANYQYGYLALSFDQEFLYVNDSNLRGRTSNIYKVRLSDFSTVSIQKDSMQIRDMMEDEDTHHLVATRFLANDICYFKTLDLEKVGCLDVGFTAVLNLIKAKDGRLVVSSETGRVAVVNHKREIGDKYLLPMQVEDMCLDRTGRFLVIGCLDGVIVLDLEAKTILRKRTLSLSSVDLALDYDGGRIFRPTAFLGDLVVLDYNTLETITRVRLRPGLRTVNYIPERNLIVVGNYFNGELYFIDADHYDLMHTLWVGTRIRDVQYSSKHKRLYVSTALRILEIDMDRLR